MTTPTTPKAGDITEEIFMEFHQRFPNAIAEVIDDYDSPTKSRIKTFIAQALAKQKESIKEQLRMERKDNEYWMEKLKVQSSDYSYGHMHAWNEAVDELNEKLDNL